MKSLSLFIKNIQKWTPEKRLKHKIAIQDKKKKLETRRRDLQAQIDTLAIQLDALYTINLGIDIPEVSDYKTRIHVSDHAVVRYIDRVLKFDTDLIRREFTKMMPDTIPRNTATLVHDNMTYQLVWLNDKILVKTFYKRKSRKKKDPQ